MNTLLSYTVAPLTEVFLKQVPNYYPQVICSKETNEKIITLTIDDVPGEYIVDILDLLKQYNSTATFFTIGKYIDKNDESGDKLKRIIDDGHEIGNHLMENYPAILLSYDNLEKSINECEEKITKIVPMTKYYRPACGIFNQRMIDIVTELGYKLVLGNIYPSDPHIKCPTYNSKYILDRIKPGSIIILHDLKHTVETLKIILPEIINKGYKIVKLSEMLN